jgi:hypothetical protein
MALEKPAGKLKNLEKGQFSDYTLKKYPLEGLGQLDQIPNYVMFFINLPENSKYEVEKVSGVTGTSVNYIDQSRGNASPLIGGATAVDTAYVAGGIAAARGISSGSGLISGVFPGIVAGVLTEASSNISKKIKTDRIVEAIQLYMPDTIFHRDQQNYDDISLTSAMGELRLYQLGAASAVDLSSDVFSNLSLDKASISQAIQTISGNKLGAELLGRLGDKFRVTGNGFTEALLRSQGVAMNPQLEMIFSRKNFRNFQFDFRFQPTSQKESEEVKKIIETFRRYSAPEIARDDMAGQYYIVPAEFDIEYYTGNQQNKYINKISSCVLETVDVNYSQAGQFAVFEGTSGAPVQIGLTLMFREVDVITREMVDEGF